MDRDFMDSPTEAIEVGGMDATATVTETAVFEPPEPAGRTVATETFEDALRRIEEADRRGVSSLVSRYLGTDIPIENLPWTKRVIDTTYNVYREHYRSGNGIVFDKAHHEIAEQVHDIFSWASKRELEYLVHADMLLYLEEHYLNRGDRDRLRSLIPDKERRAKMFADYMWKKGHGNPDEGEKQDNAVVKIFKKLFNGLKKLLFGEYFVFCLFEDIRCGRFRPGIREVRRADRRAEIKSVPEEEGCRI